MVSELSNRDLNHRQPPRSRMRQTSFPSVSRLWVAGSCLLTMLRCYTEAQGMPMDERSMPPGLRDWIGRDFCTSAPWVSAYHAELGQVLSRANAGDASAALSGAAHLMAIILTSPQTAFECATALASTMFVAAQCAEQVQQLVLGARLRQLAAIFASFDYQMKGEEYIDQSPWPMTWMDGMEGILRGMMNLKQQERSAEPWRALPARPALAERLPSSFGVPAQRIAIVSVCDYDAGITPLARLSLINKEAYARKHGYEVIMYEKAPVFQDPLSSMFTEPASHRPPAWSKVDAILTTLASTQHDWVMWMDCDSFFMDFEVRLESLAALATAANDCSGDAASGLDDLTDLRSLVSRWLQGPEDSLEGTKLLEWYDDHFAEHWKDLGYACGEQNYEIDPPVNRTLGWSEWLYKERRPHLIASEDGLMLNTGIVLIRASSWSWQFFQKVRAMTFGKSPVTQHPWWEQTAMVYLLQLPFTLISAASTLPPGSVRKEMMSVGRLGFSPACFLLSQRHINTYPPIVSSALKTHEAFDGGDFIVSFSGCKVYSSQEVCNELFFSYFFKVHDAGLLESDAALRLWA
eukprot:TRINITY_DN33778_c0_g1_i1.p1 TRINITY_DN33778_c0_g1~~TRINITY_DN33778_c0_g1_i1.p1  ORF type:complete len:590 (+),score=81.10 TRINITY_DN33778_c0_g1_i1:40-1770(+)